MADFVDDDTTEQDDGKILAALAGPMAAPPPFLFVTEHNTAEWFQGQYEVIPEHMRNGLIAYVLRGVRPGGFLRSVIMDKLSSAFAFADEVNLPLIHTYVRWFRNIPPARCHGCVEAYTNWMRIGGLIGDNVKHDGAE